MTYKIKLPQFEGPFDLLLFFIERDELDIYDIPIYQITNEFLEYIQDLEALNIELASEFILVAATLMRIKARMLLPRKQINEEGEVVDPREELVQRLLDYRRFKELVKDLQSMESTRSERQKRGAVIGEVKLISEMYSAEAEMESLTLYKLMKTFQRVLEKYDDKQLRIQHKIVKYPYTIRGEKELAKSLLRTYDERSFAELFASCDNRIHAIFRFLAVLELIQQRVFGLRLGLGINNFWIYATA